MLASFKETQVDTFGSLVSRMRAEAVPLSNAVVAQNIRFKMRGVITRSGLSKTAELPDTGLRPTGAIVFQKRNSSTGNIDQIPLFFGSNEGRYALSVESPAGSGSMVELNSNINRPNRYMDAAAAYGRAFLAFGDLKVGLESPSQTDGTSFYGVGMQQQADTCDPLSGSAGGHIAVGTRYVVVLFQNIFGAISGVSTGAISTMNVGADGFKALVQDIPISADASVVKRIVAFTVAGGSQDGPYFYIPEDDFIGDVAITKTVIDDNASTVAEFDFTDVYLQGSEDITSPVDFFDKIPLPLQAAVYYSPTNRRLIWSGGADDETIFRVSEPDDPDSYLASTGFIKPAQNDGERAITAREFRAQLYLFKEHAGFVAEPTDLAPSNWTIDKRWDRVGPVGPWAVDTSETFMVFLDKSGLYYYEGGMPVCISDEISSSDSDLWAKINWAVREKFWVFIDTDLDEIHVGVALDQAQVPSHVLKLSYLAGFRPGGRKWSVDTIPASRMFKADRTLQASPNPNTPLDQRIATDQIIVLSSNADGMINLYDPASYTDNGNGFDSRFQSGYFEQPGVDQIGAVGISLRGQGDVFIRVFKDQNTAISLPRPIPAEDALSASIVKATGLSPFWSLEFSNGGVTGSWFEVVSAVLYTKQMFKNRRP